MEPTYYGFYGNNMLSPRYIVTSPTDSYLSHANFTPQPVSQQSSPSPQVITSPAAPNFYQIQPPSPGEMLIVRTTTVTRNITSIQPLHSTF